MMVSLWVDNRGGLIYFEEVYYPDRLVYIFPLMHSQVPSQIRKAKPYQSRNIVPPENLSFSPK